MAESEQGVVNDRISLCLSGGGYRAAIFHLGAVRWLNESGLLQKVGKISCVSGGSILGAHLTHRLNPWPSAPLPREEWDERIARPFREFTRHDVRTWPVLKAVLSRVLLPWNWFRRRSAAATETERAYRVLLLGNRDVPLSALPASPELLLCATDIVFGVNWIASRDRVGDYQAGFCSPPPPEWTLAAATSASSCFPPIFAPKLVPGLDPGKFEKGEYQRPDRYEKVSGIRLTDGGVYDNLGLQPATKDSKVLSSDGGAPLRFSVCTTPWSRVARYATLMQMCVLKLRRQTLVRDFTTQVLMPDGQKRPLKAGTLWAISNGPDGNEPTYSAPVADLICNIRTDLNAFTDAEFAILENHGYLRAAARTLKWFDREMIPSPPSPTPPYPEWMDEGKVRSALRSSPRRLVIRRDWRSWVRVLLGRGW